MTSERQKHLQEVMKKLNKDNEQGFIDFASKSPEKEVISFGIKAIDDFFGGGVPRRKFTVDFGGEDTGKSSRALHLTASAQKQGLICCYIDLERKFDKERAEQMGVDISSLLLIQKAKTAEEAMDTIKTLAVEKAVDLIILDSIQAMSPKGEQESKKGKKMSIEDDQMALLARKLGKFFRTTSADVFNANIAVYLIGQVRQNLGGFFAFADLSGGNALKHWMSICVFSRRGQKADSPCISEKITYVDPKGKERTKTQKTPIGFDCVLKIVKSHIAKSAKEGADIHLPFYYESGFHAPKEDNVIKVPEEDYDHIEERLKEEPKVIPELKEKLPIETLAEDQKDLPEGISKVVDENFDELTEEKPKKKRKGRPKKKDDK